MSKVSEEVLLYAKALLKDTEKLYNKCIEFSEVTGERIKEKNSSDFEEGELADLGFIYREIEQYYDNARKEMAAKQRLIGKILGVRIIKRGLKGGDARANGELCTATPDVKTRAKLPLKGTPEWNSLLSSFGVSEVARSNNLLKLHWKHISDWLTRLDSEGRKRPPELSTIIAPETTCIYRRKSRRKNGNE